MAKKWTNAEINFLCDNIGRSNEWIAGKLDRTVGSIKLKAFELRKKNKLTGTKTPLSTLCWDCKHATNKHRVCSWANKFIPVKGWTAKSCMLYTGKDGTKAVQSYRVDKCPLFVGDWE